MTRKRRWYPDKLREIYLSQVPLYTRLTNELEFILAPRLKSAKIPIHTLTSRVKSSESFLEKAERKSYKEPLKEIEDICGLRIICLFRSDIERAIDVVRSCFLIVSAEDKELDLPVESFGYMARHLIAALPDNYSGPRYDDLKGLKAEIQVRTIATDAWANISHYLEYKTPAAVPSSLRKDFYALSGLFYLADTHFELFFQDQKKSREQTKETSQTLDGVLKQEINLDTIIAYILLEPVSAIHSFRGPLDLGDVSHLVSELLETGYRTVGDLHRDLVRAQVAFETLEQDEITEHAADGFSIVEAIRISLGLIDKRFQRYLRFWERDDYAHLISP